MYYWPGQSKYLERSLFYLEEAESRDISSVTAVLRWVEAIVCDIERYLQLEEMKTKLRHNLNIIV